MEQYVEDYQPECIEVDLNQEECISLYRAIHWVYNRSIEQQSRYKIEQYVFIHSLAMCGKKVHEKANRLIDSKESETTISFETAEAITICFLVLSQHPILPPALLSVLSKLQEQLLDFSGSIDLSFFNFNKKVYGYHRIFKPLSSQLPSVQSKSQPVHWLQHADASLEQRSNSGNG